MGDKVELGKIKLPTLATPESMLAAIEAELERGQSATVGRMLAQRKRQEKIGIRAGGAAASREEARQAIRFAAESKRRAIGLVGSADPSVREMQRAAVREAAAATARAMELTEGAKVVILFKSGGPFLYPSSDASMYSSLLAAGSKGKWVWYTASWGPNRSPKPRYYLFQPQAEQIIDQEALASSWLMHTWLVQP